MQRWFLASRVRLVVGAAVVIVVAIASIVTAMVMRRPQANEPTAWERVMSQVGEDGRVGVEMARQAFSLAYVPLPGVKVPEGDFGPPRSTSAAASWILSHWRELTGEEQRIVADVLGLATDGKVLNNMRLAAAPFPRLDGTCTKRNGVDLRDATDEFNAPVPGVKAELERLLGVKFDAAVTVCLTDQTVDEFGRNSLADTIGQHLPDGSYRCRVTFFKAGQGYQGGDRLAIFVHELTHCLFRRIAQDRKDANGLVSIPPWIDEGLNQWVTYQIVGPTKDLMLAKAGWIGDPRKPVFERSYDAIGFFGHYEQIRGGLAGRVKEIVGVAGDNYSVAAYETTLGDARDAFLDTYPSSFADSARGPQWTLEMQGLGYYKPNVPTYYVEKDADPAKADSLPYGAGLVHLVFNADVVMLQPSVGTDQAWGRFGPDPQLDFTLTDASMMAFCAKQGGCSCPDGYKPDRDFTNIGVNGYLAVTGADKPAVVAAVGYSMDRFCKEKPKPIPIHRPSQPGPAAGGGDPSVPAAGCEGKCGGSNGDPHLMTFDGYRYDLQSVGEFVLSKSTVDSFQVQARQTPMNGTSRVASVNTAFAMDVAGDRLGIYAGGNAITVKLNGATAGPGKLPKGGNLQKAGEVYVITWPDGTQAWISGHPGFGLVINMKAGDSRQSKLTGLLGNFDGDDTNDLVRRDGTVITKRPLAYEDLYPSYADDWRVTGSLFDYEPGQSTATFTDRTFPDNTSITFDRAAAEATCRAAGITDPGLLETCIFDVGVSGNSYYAEQTAQVQRFLTSRSASNMVEGTIGADGNGGEHAIQIGDAIAFTLQDAGGAVSVCDAHVTIEGVQRRSATEEECKGALIIGLLAKSTSGKAMVKVGGPAGSYRWKVVPIKTKELTVKPGQRVTGHIDAHEAHLYYLDVDRPVFLSGLPSTCNDLVWQHTFVTIDMQMHTTAFGWVDEQGPMCQQGRRGFVGNNDAQRRVVLVIRGKDLASSGDYSFQID